MGAGCGAQGAEHWAPGAGSMKQEAGGLKFELSVIELNGLNGLPGSLVPKTKSYPEVTSSHNT